MRSSILFSFLYNIISFSEVVMTPLPRVCESDTPFSSIYHALGIPNRFFDRGSPHPKPPFCHHRSLFIPSYTQFATRETPFTIIHTIHTIKLPNSRCNQPTEPFVYLSPSLYPLCSVLPDLLLLPVPPHQVIAERLQQDSTCTPHSLTGDV